LPRSTNFRQCTAPKLRALGGPTARSGRQLSAWGVQHHLLRGVVLRCGSAPSHQGARGGIVLTAGCLRSGSRSARSVAHTDICCAHHTLRGAAVSFGSAPSHRVARMGLRAPLGVCAIAAVVTTWLHRSNVRCRVTRIDRCAHLMLRGVALSCGSAPSNRVARIGLRTRLGCVLFWPPRRTLVCANQIAVRTICCEALH